jgi:hypothetical protein
MTYGFSPAFYRADPNGGPVSQVPFAFRIGWHEDTTFIELRNPSGEVIASRIVSLSAPEVMLRTPNGGEAFQQGDPIQTRWEASDADLDEIAFSLFISNDAGLSWLPLAIDLAENRYTIETNDLELGESYLVRIMATDGVNTAYDVSDAVFAITDEAHGLPLWLMIVGGALVVIIVGALAWIGANRFLRSRRSTE